MDERKKLLSEFLQFTGTDDEAKAITFFEASDWNLQNAVELFYAEQGTADPGPSQEHEEDVRAPLPTKFERMIDNPEVYEQRLRGREKQTQIYEAFRNHTAELAEYLQGPDAKGGTTGLAKLYKAPIDLVFRGNFEQAKEAAMDKDLWLMVNVQSAEEFASHQLNCDTFSNEALKEMIKANFIFLQTYTSGVTGERLTMMYRIQQCPCVLVIDPITGALMQSFHGFIEAERLIEDLIQYMDCKPNDEAGAKLLQSKQRGRNRPTEEMKSHQSPTLTREMQDALADALEASKKRKPDKSESKESADGNDEGSSQVVQDQPICRKIQCTASSKEKDEFTEKESSRRRPMLSSAPETAGEDTCIVGILLPNGKRLQRSFYRSDKIENVYAFCQSEYPEAEERDYKLIPRVPGSKPTTDWELSIQGAEIAGSMLAFIWD